MLGKIIRFVKKSKAEVLKNTSILQSEVYFPFGLIGRPPKDTKVMIVKDKSGQAYMSFSIQQNTVDLKDNDVVVSNGKAKVYLKADGGIEISTEGSKASIDLTAAGDMNIKASKINITGTQLDVDADSAFKKQITNNTKDIGADHTHKVTYDRHPEGGTPTKVTSEGVD